MDQPFTVDAFFELNQLTDRVPFDLSADGQMLALTMKNCRRQGDLGDDDSYTTDGVPRGMVGSRVLIIDTATGTVEEPFPAARYTSWGAQWSPDGEKLAAYVQGEVPACLAIWERATGTFKLYPHVAIRPFFGFEVPQWVAQTALIVKVAAIPKREQSNTENKTKECAVTTFTFSPDDQRQPDKQLLAGWADGYICHVALVDITTGQIQLLAENWRLIGWKVAPDAQSVAVFRYIEYDSPQQQFFFDLMVLPLHESGGEPRLLAHRIPQEYGIHFNWSPDSRWIAYTTQERGAKSGLFVVAADGSTTARALHDPEQELELVDQRETPRWSENGEVVYCLVKRGYWAFAANGSTRQKITLSGDADETIIDWLQSPGDPVLRTPVPNTLLCLVRTDKKGTSIWAVNMQNGTSEKRFELAKRMGRSSFDMEVSDSNVYLMLEASNHPAELWQYPWDFQQQRRLYTLNPQLAHVSFGSSRLLEYRALDGTQQRATLLLPAGYTPESTVPLVVEVYGGSKGSNYLHLFGCTEDILHGQLLAAHGYAVLCPDMPMQDFDPLKQLPGLVLPAINYLIDWGIADPARIGLMGQSYGGYCALALLVQTNVFSAAVASAGCYNFVSEYLTVGEDGTDGWLGWVESGQGRMGGTLWEKRTSYIENSPIFYLDRVQTPVMLVCGSEDRGAPTQAEAVFAGLRRLGKKVELRRYEGEGHWSGRWSEPAYRDLYERVLAWFDEHFKK